MASETPAEIWGLPEKRKSSAGADADLVILNAEGVNGTGDYRDRRDPAPQRS
jgi:dihydroorotase-like cyclic amidohydrolase